MIKFVAPTLPATAMPSMRLVAPSWRFADGLRAARLGKAITGGKAAARKRIAPTGAPAYAHVVCVAQHTFQVMGENSASLAAPGDAGESLGNGITQVQAQLSVDGTRADGRAGSPPRGEPV